MEYSGTEKRTGLERKEFPFLIRAATHQYSAFDERAKQPEKLDYIQDSALENIKTATFAVADGVGGYAGGQRASNAFIKTLTRAGEGFRDMDEKAIVELIPKVFQVAHERIVALGAQMTREEPKSKNENDPSRDYRRMATTASFLQFCRNAKGEPRAVIGHLGDSSILRIRGGDITKLTKEMPQNSTEPPFLGLGREKVRDPEMISTDVKEGDVYLLVTDGVWKNIEDKTILRFYQEQLVKRFEPKERVSKLADRISDPGKIYDLNVRMDPEKKGIAVDDMTAVVVFVGEKR